MKTRKFYNITIKEKYESSDFLTIKSYIEKPIDNIKKKLPMLISDDLKSRKGAFCVVHSDNKNFSYSARVCVINNQPEILLGFYDADKNIISDCIDIENISKWSENHLNRMEKRLENAIKYNLQNADHFVNTAWTKYTFLYNQAINFINENKFSYDDFCIQTPNCIDFKLTDNYFAGSLYCRFNPLSYNFKYIDGNNKEIPFTSITPKLWAEEVFPKINIIGDFIKGNVERFQARINGNYDLKEKYPHFNCDDIIKEVNNRIQAQKELQTMNKVIWDFGNSLANRKIIEPEFTVNDLNLKATVNHKISVPVVHLCIEDSEIIFRDPLNNEIEFAPEVKAKLQNELDAILKATFERMDNGLNKGGLIIDSSYEEPDFEY